MAGIGYDPSPEYQPLGEWGGVVKYGNDRHLVVMFYVRSVHNPVKSQQAGRRMHDMMDYVKMHAPGEQMQVIDRPVVEDDKRRFPRQWEQFQRGRQQIPDGTPIDLLFPSHPHIADNLRSYGVHTIEACAEMSQPALDSIGMGAQDYKNRASDYLAAANDGSAHHKFTTEIEALKRENGRLKRQMEDLMLQHAQMLTQMQRGMPVPSAMVPQNPLYASAPGQPGSYQFAAPNGEPIRGETEFGQVPVDQPATRNDLMAELPRTGKIMRRRFKRKEGDADENEATSQA